MKLNEVAAAVHRRMCEDERFGYSWEERYGAFWEEWEVMGKRGAIRVGDYECGTSVKTAWAWAFAGTPWEGSLEGYIYSRNCAQTFLSTGLFEKVPVTQAQVGDIYLNEANHVAMCQPDGQLSEFSWGDNGAYGNRRGDQSGRESSVHGYYSYPWDFVLHYNGGADGVEPHQPESEPMNDAGLRYRAHVANLGWLKWRRDGQTAGTTGFGVQLEALEIEPPEGVEIHAKAHMQNVGWKDFGTARHGSPLVVGTVGEGLRMECLLLECAGAKALYRVHEQDTGWKGVTPMGYATGSDGQRRQLEAVQLWMEV